MKVSSYISNLGSAASIIVTLALVLFAGFLVTRVTKKLHLPNVTGYIFAGILLGPNLLQVLNVDFINSCGFITDIALAYISFGAGKYLKISVLRKSGPQIIIITLLEALIANLLISLSMYFIFGFDLSFSLLLGAIACATAPASTLMTIRQYKAKGSFVNTILQVIALDNIVALLIFSVCTSISQASSTGKSVTLETALMPIIWNLLSIACGFVFGYLLFKLVSTRRSQDHKLVLTNAFIFLLTGLCAVVDVSPLLGCMILGATYINFNGNKQLFKQVNGFTPPFLLLFFVLSGARLNLTSLVTVGIVGVVYFFVRITGKYIGATLGAMICKSSVQVKKYLGLALIPQAGVSIGLAVLAQRLLPPEEGNLLSTIILSSAVLYEMIGPACAKASLFLSGSIPPKKNEPALPAKKNEPALPSSKNQPALPIKKNAPTLAAGQDAPPQAGKDAAATGGLLKGMFTKKESVDISSAETANKKTPDKKDKEPNVSKESAAPSDKTPPAPAKKAAASKSNKKKSPKTKGKKAKK